MSEVTNQPVKEEPKTFVQRFQEIESDVLQLKEVFKLHNGIIQTFIQEMSSLREQHLSVRNIVNAMLKLVDDSKLANTANVVAKYTEIQAEMFKKNIEDAVKAGNLKVVEAVKSLDHIVAFASNDVLYGYSKVSEFVDEKVKEAMSSAVVGDVIQGLKVLGVYEPSTPQPTNPENPALSTSEESDQNGQQNS